MGILSKPGEDLVSEGSPYTLKDELVSYRETISGTVTKSGPVTKSEPVTLNFLKFVY